MGVTLKQKKRSCGNNCPPLTKKTIRSFKIYFRSEYKRFLIQLKFMKLNQKRKQAFCPLYFNKEFNLL